MIKAIQAALISFYQGFRDYGLIGLRETIGDMRTCYMLTLELERRKCLRY